MAPGECGLQQTQPRQSLLTGWLKKETRADRARLWEPLDKRHVVAAPRQRNSARLAGDPAADYPDVQLLSPCNSRHARLYSPQAGARVE